jgi:phage gp29-like protein
MLQDPRDIEAFGIGIKNLRDAGLNIGQAWVRKQIGAPEPKKGEELLSDGQPDPAATQPGGTGKPAGDKPKPAEEDASAA